MTFIWGQCAAGIENHKFSPCYPLLTALGISWASNKHSYLWNAVSGASLCPISDPPASPPVPATAAATCPRSASANLAQEQSLSLCASHHLPCLELLCRPQVWNAYANLLNTCISQGSIREEEPSGGFIDISICYKDLTLYKDLTSWMLVRLSP